MKEWTIMIEKTLLISYIRDDQMEMGIAKILQTIQVAGRPGRHPIRSVPDH